MPSAIILPSIFIVTQLQLNRIIPTLLAITFELSLLIHTFATQHITLSKALAVTSSHLIPKI